MDEEIRKSPSDPDQATDLEGGGQSRGRPADGVLDGDNGSSTFGSSPGMNHWRESVISRPGLEDRGNVFFAAIEMTRMPMILTDPNLPDNPIAFANKAFLDLTGYEESEVLGRNCRFLQGANTDRETVAALRDAVNSGGSIACEILNYKRDGTPFWNAVFIGPVFDESGKLAYQFASQLDVTRRRNSEQSFRQAQKMESIGQLTAGLAHDFNNLLQVVNGNLELLENCVDGDRAQRYIGNARSAAERGAKLTRQLLAFARKTRLSPKPTDLSALVTNFIDVIESSLGSQVHLQLNLRRRLPRVMVDPEQLEMALLNILMNARDAMPSGGVVTIATRAIHLNGDAPMRQLPEGDYVAIEVSDEGTGMSDDVIERATEPFFTTKSQGKGTGLGLAMASGFVQQSRGRLEIESEIGKGAMLRMLFPVAHDQEDEVSARPPERQFAIVENRGHPIEHLLVVEDSIEVLELAIEILEAAGYRVTTADSGEAALRLFEKTEPGTFDLLFTDLVMPGGINGLMLADEVRKRDPKIGILLTTGYNEELVIAGPDRPHKDVLGKPYRRSELLDRVRQALNQRADIGETRRTPSDYGAVEA
ncbi:histidine kinase famiy protein [Sphingomonas astaxanthinifaciens]|uniref:histidine kinase n=1 Tax=Sphingomonas astaxanthinifaciens DSM 22298 TaxID=1123267 RepID=A0ABQ5Z194_9SPHN|nr:histidine kinase famiy protein [Sphingomonas astaxanthinifaciens]GLR46514.1 hybrid sensor histidine kinase/response regulator [Sphingomonas astaxanthinifaciens DSM 22298]